MAVLAAGGEICELRNAHDPAQVGSQQERTIGGGMRRGVMRSRLGASGRTLALGMSLVILSAVLTSCSFFRVPDLDPRPLSITPSCDAAFAEASLSYAAHLEEHPLYTELKDPLYADGELSDRERVLVEDAKAEYDRIVDPIYDACSGVEDLYAGAFNHRSEELWWAAMLVDDVTHEIDKAGFIESQCEGRETRPACEDYVPS
ncbi:hypothetical protein LQ938_11685 [Microbacterium sp. cx-55]|uniref:hypothetical protein n=1 Tax=Microbacterium sp. cx-55 TaxID=2875948 RepID=UPI001CBFC580|nr:hypothetical protein [Microbacterium sp. cx-55]MBZ4488067.1 hypothetical protein [Microbacterium sp. cx-55]UGB34527.1 hypothetical protein LQ938_11685 [Microbacterium sp. cx-55]